MNVSFSSQLKSRFPSSHKKNVSFIQSGLINKVDGSWQIATPNSSRNLRKLNWIEATSPDFFIGNTAKARLTLIIASTFVPKALPWSFSNPLCFLIP